MADTPTTNLALVKPEIGASGWATKQHTLYDRLDTLLGVTLTAGQDPNVAAVEGYQNAIISDANGVLWICTANGTSNWVKLASLVFPEIQDTRNQWDKAQYGSWNSVVASAGPLTPSLDDNAISVLINQALTINKPDDTLVDTFQIIILRMEVGGTSYQVTWNEDYYDAPSGIALSGIPPVNSVTYYTLMKTPDIDKWAVFPNSGYTY